VTVIEFVKAVVKEAAQQAVAEGAKTVA